MGFVGKRRVGLTAALVVLALAVAATVIHFVVLLTANNGAWSVPIDDTYIHFQYARAFAEGHPFSYHPGDGYSTGCTSPLYTVLLAIPYALGAKGMLLVPVTLVLGGVWLTLTTLLIIRVGGQLHAPGAGRAAAAIWSTWGFTWYCMFCGMETGLWITLLLTVLTLTITAFRRLDGRPTTRLLVVASLLPVTRPEGLALLGVLGLVVMHRTWARFGLRKGIRPLLAWSPVVIPAVIYYAANRILTGTFSTAGMISKSLMHAPYFTPHKRALQFFDQLLEVVRHFLLGQDPLFLALAVSLPGLAAILAIGLREWGKRVAGARLLMALWTVASLLLASGHYIRIARWDRYYLPFFLLIIIGCGYFWRWVARSVRQRYLLGAMTAALVFYQGDVIVRWMEMYRKDVKTIHSKQAATARAARALPKGTRLLVCDAGAIPYLSGKWTFDIVGLTTPLRHNWFRAGVGSRFELFERLPRAKRPTYIAAYDFCLWEGARGVIQEMNRDMVLAPVAETLAGSGEAPTIKLPARLAVADRVDVADLESEARHDYRRKKRGTIRDNVLRRASKPGGDATMADGGRLVKRQEWMTFAATPNKPVTVVGRYTVGFDMTLMFRVGRFIKKISLEVTPADDWSEVSFKIPAKYVKSENHMTVKGMANKAYHVYHYFFLQPGMAKKKGPDAGVAPDATAAPTPQPDSSTEAG